MLSKLAKRLWTLFIILPLAILLILFAVANRGLVTISMDPTNAVEPMFALSAPLFVALFAAIMLGVLVGGTAVWLTQGQHRKAARNKSVEVSKLARERDVQKEQINRMSGTRALPSPASLR